MPLLRIRSSPTDAIRFARMLTVTLAATALAQCASDGGVNGLDVPVDAPGPFGVGFRELSVTYTPPDGGPARTIPVAVWYPADPEATAANPLSEPPRYLLTVSEVAVVDAPMAPPAYRDGYPVIIHSHGHMAWETYNYHIGESFAARGYVVVAPGHVGNRIFDLNTYVEAVDDFYERNYDVRATLDALASLPSDDPLAGRCNTERVVMSGHSRGGSVTWGILGARIDKTFLTDRCAADYYQASGGCPAEKLAVYDRPMRDPRIVAGVPLDGDGENSYFGGYPGMDVVEAPILMMSVSGHPVSNDEIFAMVTHPPMIWVEFVGGCHAFFGDGVCADGLIDASVALPASLTFMHAFARRHIFDDQRAETLGILDGSRPVADATILTFHGR